jgi:PleD family two-component response regulator
MRVTLSAGVATLRPEETTDSILARADSALYAAKAQGRNRIARG